MKAFLAFFVMASAGVVQISCGDDHQSVIFPPTVLDANLLPVCAAKRIKIVYTAPDTLRLGEETQVEAHVFADPPRTDYRVSWSLVNDDAHTARGKLSEMEKMQACLPGSASCVKFTCTGTGGKAVDAGTETPVSGLWIMAKYEDPTCFDTSRVPLRCEKPLLP